MVYNNRNHWVCGLSPSSRILNKQKDNVSETVEILTLLGPSERAILNHWTTHVQVQVQVQVNLRPTVSRPVCLGAGNPSGTRDQFFLSP
jgi:hypothetical protein